MTMQKIFPLHLKNERGVMLLSVVFLLLITSFMAMMILNGTKKIQNNNVTLRVIAIHLAQEQFAELENRAAEGKLSAGSEEFLGVKDDLKTLYNSGGDTSKKIPVEFKVSTDISNFDQDFLKAEVKVEWIIEGKLYSIESEKIVYVTPAEPDENVVDD